MSSTRVELGSGAGTVAWVLAPDAGEWGAWGELSHLQRSLSCGASPGTFLAGSEQQDSVASWTGTTGAAQQQPSSISLGPMETVLIEQPPVARADPSGTATPAPKAPASGAKSEKATSSKTLHERIAFTSIRTRVALGWTCMSAPRNTRRVRIRQVRVRLSGQEPEAGDQVMGPTESLLLEI